MAVVNENANIVVGARVAKIENIMGAALLNLPLSMLVL
jgi:hypothetical protein